MPYDENLANRIRSHLGPDPAYTERKMFGGLAFMYQGNMACGILNNNLMLRTGPEQYEKVLSLPHAKVMDFTGRQMKGMVLVEPEGFTTDSKLSRWLEICLSFTQSLPPKSRK